MFWANEAAGRRRYLPKAETRNSQQENGAASKDATIRERHLILLPVKKTQISPELALTTHLRSIDAVRGFLGNENLQDYSFDKSRLRGQE